MYCRSCGKVVEPEIPDALTSARLSLRTMLIAAYLNQTARMSVESVSSAMREIFGIRISEGEIQEIVYQLSHALGSEYDSLVESIRKAPSRYTDTTTWRKNGGNHALWVFVTKEGPYSMSQGAITIRLPSICWENTVTRMSITDKVRSKPSRERRRIPSSTADRT